jgi:hypothetical protein
MIRRVRAASLLWLLVISSGMAHAQTASYPLNSSVSDFGTTYVFSPPPVCGGCVETELGFLHLGDENVVPSVVTFALPRGHTDISTLVNLLDSDTVNGRRATRFGDRFDFVIRQQLWTKGGFTMTVAPRGAVYVRSTDGGRAGITLAPQYSRGRNLFVLNLTETAGVGVSDTNPRSDFLVQADYFRTLEKRGTAVLFGYQQEQTAGTATASIEEGVVLPFRNGQVELSTQQINLNGTPQAQVQAKVIVNWGSVLKRK